MPRLRFLYRLLVPVATILCGGTASTVVAQQSEPEETPQAQIGGRIHIDWLFDDEGDTLWETFGAIQDDSEVRRARLYLKGNIQEGLEYMVEYDFAGEGGAFKDLYIGVSEIPALGTGLRIGHFKEPFSLEELISSNDITFLERALPNALAPSRNVGAMVYDSLENDRMTWALGVFQGNSDDFAYDDDDSEGGEYAVTGRLTALPYYVEDGRCLLHLGAAASHRTPNAHAIGFSQSPEAHLSPDFVETGTYDAEELNLFGTEAAMVLGPASVQAEWIKAETEDTLALGDPEFDGYYLYLSYLLTGEHRPYELTSGTFDGVKPNRNFLDGGGGAWELVGRYSHLNLNDGLIVGGELTDYTVGLNWYWNPNTRVMFNYVRANVERDDLALDEEGDLFQFRFQFDF